MKIYELKFSATHYFSRGEFHKLEREDRKITSRVDANSLEHSMEIVRKRFKNPRFASVKILFTFETEQEFQY